MVDRDAFAQVLAQQTRDLHRADILRDRVVRTRFSDKNARVFAQLRKHLKRRGLHTQ